MELLTLAPGNDRIPVELFQILKDDAVESAALNMQYALNMHYAGSQHPSLSEFSTVYCDHHSQGFGIVNKAEIDVFLELSCFFHDPADVGNLISGSSAFSKTSLNIRMFTVHILLKPGLENFEHFFNSV